MMKPIDHALRLAPPRRHVAGRAVALAAAVVVATATGVLLGAPGAHAARDTPDDGGDGGIDTPAAFVCTGFADYDAVVATTDTTVTLSGPVGPETSVTYAIDDVEQTTTGAPVTYAVADERTYVSATAVAPGNTLDTYYSVYPDGGRISGPNRYATSVQVGVDTNMNSCADTVFIANGEGFADALSSTPLVVANLFGELLLSQRDALTAEVRDEIEFSGASNVVLLGGTAALSPALCDQMPATIDSCTRISGQDRYATSLALADALLTARGSDSVSGAFIVSGERFPDAVSVAGLAAYLGAPVILVPGSATSVSPATLAWLEEHVTDGVSIVGGTASVSDGIEAQLQASVGTVRLSGANRYETSAAVAQVALEFIDQPSYALLASGERFPDALTGGVLAGSSGMPLLLTGPSCLPAPIAQSIDAFDPAGVLAIGGTAAVSDAALTQPC